MKVNKLFKNVFTSNILFEDSVSYRRLIVINASLILSMFAFSAFMYINFFIIKNYLIFSLDIFTFFIALFTFLQLRKNKNIPQAALISTFLIILFILLFIIENQNRDLGIIWTIFPGFFAMLLNGKRIGLVLTIFFYSIMFYLAYINIGIWDDGNWGNVDLYRYVFAIILVTSVSYMAESAYEMSDRELAIVRANEIKVLEELKKKAITDGLTGMHNRRYFNEIVPKILKTAQRDQKYVSFFILDIDYFKNYNDLYGHQSGDEALKKVSQALISFVQRENDLVFRIGGEEFAGIVHVQSVQDAEQWLSKLNDAILDLDIEHLESQLKIKKLTVSIGVCSKLATQELDIDFYYKQADKALYRAKESGRNRLVASE